MLNIAERDESDNGNVRMPAMRKSQPA
jgi:hypothetical protein